MNDDVVRRVIATLEGGELPDYVLLDDERSRDELIPTLLEFSQGRRWLRSWPALNDELAGRLVQYESDFRTNRRDQSLANLVQNLPEGMLVSNSLLIAASPAAPALWTRLAAESEMLAEIATDLIANGERQVAENTLYLLVLDPLDPFSIGEGARIKIAGAALSSRHTTVRSLGAEYLFDHQPEAIAGEYLNLVFDEDERIRGLGWAAGVRFDPSAAIDTAVRILYDESEPIAVRRSALAAFGTSLETSDVVDILAEFVVHPNAELALDAGSLLYRIHRHPTIAMAAAQSPHADVREIGEFLLDPYRGSPAAGGSRPGDPTRSDVFAEMIRQTEERISEHDVDNRNRD